MTSILNVTDYFALSHLLILLLGGLILLLLESFSPSRAKKRSFSITLSTLALSLIATLVQPVSTNPLLTPWLHFDSISRFFTTLFLMSGIGITLLSYSFFKRFNASQGEYYFLLLSSVIGMILIGHAADFLTLFLGLEALSISIYILSGYMKKWEGSSESAIKYFLMGSIATGFFLYGIALVYGAIGHTSFASLLASYHAIFLEPEKALFLGGIALVTFGLIFKAAIVPFHFWAPDVYAGSSTPVTALMAVGIKAGAFAALTRVFMEALYLFDPLWNSAIAALVYPTLIYSNILAIRQKHLRRFFAYSGISHAGFLLIPIAVGNEEAHHALSFYLVVYVIATLGAFAVLASLDKDSRGVMIEDLKGLFQRAPLLACVFSLCLLTLAGFPPTVGFFAKFMIFKSAFQAGYYDLVVLGLITTIFSTFYYFRFISAMLTPAAEGGVFEKSYPSEKILGVLCSAAILWCSCFPSTLSFVY